MVALLNLFNNDFKDFIESLHKFDMAYILIGGYAVVLYGYHRTTGKKSGGVGSNVEKGKVAMTGLSEFSPG